MTYVSTVFESLGQRSIVNYSQGYGVKPCTSMKPIAID